MRKGASLSKSEKEGGFESDSKSEFEPESESRMGVISDGGYKSEVDVGADTTDNSSFVGTIVEKIEGREKRKGEATMKLSPMLIVIFNVLCISTSAMLNWMSWTSIASPRGAQSDGWLFVHFKL